MHQQLTTAPLGETGIAISRVGLGTWAIGGPDWQWGWGAQDDDDSVRSILRAVERGVGWIDTAAAYGFGHSEAVVARALSTLPEADRPLVFTKCGLVDDGNGQAIRVGRPFSLIDEAHASLRRLATDRLDVLFLHWPPEDGTSLQDAWETLLRLRDEGVARWIGVSNVDLEQLARLDALGRVDVVQPSLSLINRDVLDNGTLAWCAERGTGVVVYAPMASGILSGRYDEQAAAALPAGDWRRENPDFSGEGLRRNLALVARLREIAGEIGCSVGELAIAWTLHQAGVSGAIVGARRPDQVDGWTGAGELQLDDELLGQIAGALEATGTGTGERAY